MDPSKYERSHRLVSPSLCHEPDKTSFQAPPFLRIPVELRLEIYKHALMISRRPRPQDLHENILSETWKDVPTPLLYVNRQIRAEVCDCLKRGCFTMRVTAQDIEFDSFALSCFIAQQRRKDLNGLRRLIVEIWPPHPERPVDVYHIWKNVQKLRNNLRAIPQLQELHISFLENDIATWSHGGKALQLLDSLKQPAEDLEFSDVGLILGLFIRLTNVKKAAIGLPMSVGHNQEDCDGLLDYACITIGTMTGSEPPNNDIDYDWFEDHIDGHSRDYLQTQTARITRDKLDEITHDGSCKMEESSYDTFVKIWGADFQGLQSYTDPKGKFLGKWFYVEYVFPPPLQENVQMVGKKKGRPSTFVRNGKCKNIENSPSLEHGSTGVHLCANTT